MALDRAFALEPHGGTLHLRGHVLRQAGRYLAAEVAFEGAAQAAEFPAQRQAAEREIGVTRRYAAFPGFRPDTLTPSRHWFAETGTIPLIGGYGDPAGETDIALAVKTLAGDVGWRFSVLVALDAWEGWSELAQALGVPVAAALSDDSTSIPLVVARDPTALPSWESESQTPARRGRGLSMALYQDPELATADLVGQLTSLPTHAVDLAFAVEASQHPEGRLRGRVLG